MKFLLFCGQIILILLMLFLIVACSSSPLVSPEDGTTVKQINSPLGTPFTNVVTKVTQVATLVPTTPTPTPTSTSTPIPTIIIPETPVPSPTPPTVYPTTTWKPPQNIARDVTNDWLTYIDEKAGYSFKYPPNATFLPGTSVQGRFTNVYGYLPVSPEFNPYIFVAVEENLKELTLEQYLTEKYIESTGYPNISPEYLASIETIEVNGFLAVWDKANRNSEVFIVISTQDKLFSFQLSNGDMVASDLRTVDNISKDTFYQIVSSFTLFQSENP